MSITDPYVAAEEFKSAKGLRDPSHDLFLEDLLEGISRELERDLGQFFGIDAAVVSRVYIGKGCNYLDLDLEGDGCPGIATLTGLVLTEDADDDGSFADETAWTINTDFEARPLNADKGPEPVPWHRLYIPAWSTKGVFTAGRRYHVTAKFGWPAVPRRIKDLTLELADTWLGGPRATERISELDDVVSLSPLARSMLHRARDLYRKVTLV